MTKDYQQFKETYILINNGDFSVGIGETFIEFDLKINSNVKIDSTDIHNLQKALKYIFDCEIIMNKKDYEESERLRYLDELYLELEELYIILRESKEIVNIDKIKETEDRIAEIKQKIKEVENKKPQINDYGEKEIIELIDNMVKIVQETVNLL